jgi:hypothetical protein
MTGFAIVLLHISLGLDNLNRCEKNGMNVELLTDLEFIRNVIRGIIVIIWSYYWYELLTECFPDFSVKYNSV